MAKKIRKEYGTLQFFPERNLINSDETLALFNRRFLKLSNWTDAEIDALGDLSELEESMLRELLEVDGVGPKRAREIHDVLTMAYAMKELQV